MSHALMTGCVNGKIVEQEMLYEGTFYDAS